MSFCPCYKRKEKKVNRKEKKRKDNYRKEKKRIEKKKLKRSEGRRRKIKKCSASRVDNLKSTESCGISANKKQNITF